MQLAERYIATGMLIMLSCLGTRSAETEPGDEDNNALPPFGHTFFCLRYPHDCERTASTEALPVSLAGRWHKMNLVNTSVNAAIAPRADPDRVSIHWRIAPADGDCNDYAVTKRHRLLSAG
jgi:predicted transglutaminase-like cysteine proteinase